jgi:hypothetical protein
VNPLLTGDDLLLLEQRISCWEHAQQSAIAVVGMRTWRWAWNGRCCRRRPDHTRMEEYKKTGAQ